MMISIIYPFNLYFQPLKKLGGSWCILVDYVQVVVLIAAAIVPDVIFLLKQIKNIFHTCYLVIELANAPSIKQHKSNLLLCEDDFSAHSLQFFSAWITFQPSVNTESCRNLACHEALSIVDIKLFGCGKQEASVGYSRKIHVCHKMGNKTYKDSESSKVRGI